jgi:hypothetical protein
MGNVSSCWTKQQIEIDIGKIAAEVWNVARPELQQIIQKELLAVEQSLAARLGTVPVPIAPAPVSR